MPVERSGKIGFSPVDIHRATATCFIHALVYLPCSMHDTLGQAISERDIFAPGFNSAPTQRKLDTVLMVSARITVLNPNDKIPCNSTSRRISRDVTATSETWQVMPMTNEKYAKSR